MDPEKPSNDETTNQDMEKEVNSEPEIKKDLISDEFNDVVEATTNDVEVKIVLSTTDGDTIINNDDESSINSTKTKATTVILLIMIPSAAIVTILCIIYCFCKDKESKESATDKLSRVGVSQQIDTELAIPQTLHTDTARQ